MFIPASSEFVALCQSQVAVLTQGMGAALSAVYLTTEELVAESTPKLIPVVVYPETETIWEDDETDLLLPDYFPGTWRDRNSQGEMMRRLKRVTPQLLPQQANIDPEVTPNWQDNSFHGKRQIVLPLIHEGVVMGLLVTGREDRQWNDGEQAAIEHIARTLTIAYLIDRRRFWLEQQLTQQRMLQGQQNALLHNLLHQIRNPLTALRTFGKLLFRRLRPGDKNQEVAGSIIRESDRLQELLQDFDRCLDIYPGETNLLPLPTGDTPILPSATISEVSPMSLPEEDSRLKGSGGVLTLLPGKTLSLESISVTDVLQPLLVSANAIAQERDLQLSVSIPAHLPPVIGNGKALREVLSNLIDNALKYTPAGGQIYIQVAIDGDTPHQETDILPHHRSPTTSSSPQKIRIVMSDTGPGIPPQDINRLFERHYRGVQAETAIPGTGLGLAIAKELVELMDGNIEVFSPAISFRAKQNLDNVSGKGTTFVVSLLIANG